MCQDVHLHLALLCCLSQSSPAHPDPGLLHGSQPGSNNLHCWLWPLGAPGELPAAWQPAATAIGNAARRRPRRRPLWEAAENMGKLSVELNQDKW